MVTGQHNDSSPSPDVSDLVGGILAAEVEGQRDQLLLKVPCLPLDRPKERALVARAGRRALLRTLSRATLAIVSVSALVDTWPCVTFSTGRLLSQRGILSCACRPQTS